MKKTGVLFLFMILMISACKLKQPEISNLPVIDFESVVFRKLNENEDILVLKLKFEDGNGDLGLTSEDKFGVYREWYEWRYLNGPNRGQVVFFREDYNYNRFDWEIVGNDTLEVAERGLAFIQKTNPVTNVEERVKFDGTVDQYNNFDWEIVPNPETNENDTFSVSRPVLELIKIRCDGEGIETQEENIKFKKNGDIRGIEWNVPIEPEDRLISNPNTLARVCRNDLNFHNFFATILFKDVDGSFRPVFEAQSGNTSAGAGELLLWSRFPILNESGEDRPLKGTLVITIKEALSGNAIIANNPLKLEVSIKDRALNNSNTIQTPEFRLLER